MMNTNYHSSISFWTMTLALLALVLLALPDNDAFSAPPQSNVKFDHIKTGFPLVGAHSTTPCETCHVRGIFRGTPNQCANCHSPGSRIATTVKPAKHVPSSAPCEQCHTSSVSWLGARFSHATISPGSCTTCHNNGIAPGKPSNHMQTTTACDTCHRTTAWIPASFNHATVTPGSCGTCHNGTQATGKPSNHMQTTAACDTCHRTTAWIPATFSHATVTPGSCGTSCHNGSGPGKAKPSGHFATARSCDACHHSTNVGGFALPVSYSHTSPYYKTHSSTINSNCRGCHTGGTEVATWSFSAYKPDCAGCHAGRFVPDPHKKTETPTTIFYTVSELRNCSGSCHLYTDNTFTTIKTNRSSEHRATDGGF